MKKSILFLILTYLFLIINSFAINQNSDENNSESENILKIGVLLPLSGKFKGTGESFLKAIQLALFDISIPFSISSISSDPPGERNPSPHTVFNKFSCFGP